VLEVAVHLLNGFWVRLAGGRIRPKFISVLAKHRAARLG
jgi:hypothetical protein